MIRAILWKEFREQGLIALTLIVLGAGVLVAAATLADPPVPDASPADVLGYLGAGHLATVLLAVTAGTVCGGALFAAEREAGTIGFLEGLPVSRWRLWQVKLFAGGVLVTAEVGTVLAVAAGLGLVDTVESAERVAVEALLAFAWGAYGSTLARTTLGSVGMAVPAAALAAFAFAFTLLVAFPQHGQGVPRLGTTPVLVYVVLMLATPLVASAVLFTRQDRERAADDPTPVYHPPAGLAPGRPAAELPCPARSRFGLKALGWLTARQLVGPGEVVSGFAVTFGLTMLVPTIQPSLVWPPLALAAGVLAGVMVFADEQAHGAARFWGERRLPVGRAWAVKLGLHLAFAAWLVFLLALPLAVRALSNGQGRGDTTLSVVFRAPLFDSQQLGGQAWKYLLAPAVYGFAAGHLCGMLFHKAVVAAGVAGVVGGTGAALWVPSLLAGGVAHWQLWLPPVLVLGTGRLLIRAWATDRIGSPGPLAALAGGLAAAAVATAAGIGYRVLEVPDRPDGGDDQRYVAELPEGNDGGREFRSAAEQFAVAAEATGETTRQPPTSPVRERLERIPLTGWPTGEGDDRAKQDRQELDDWLGRVYRPPADPAKAWYVTAARAAGSRVGMFEHPKLTADPTRLSAIENGRQMGTVVLARGLQLQAAGDPAAFRDALRTALVLSRSLRNGSLTGAWRNGVAVARHAFHATDRWLAALDGHPALVREALQLVAEDDHTLLTRWDPATGRVSPPEVAAGEPTEPFDPTPHLLAERYIIRDQVKAPAAWLAAQLNPGGDKDAATPAADLVAFAWSVPWERERTRRLVGLGFEAGLDAGYRGLLRGRPGERTVFGARNPTPPEMAEGDLQLRVLRRATLLRLAARLYQTEHERFPADLNELVRAGYLSAVPTDPCSGQPFRYRIAGPEGEDLGLPRFGTTRARVEPGQPILWSVGKDLKDDGGRSTPAGGPSRGNATDDLVYLVPLPAGDRK